MITILHEDGESLVIDKPAGLPIEQPRAGGRSLEDHLGGSWASSAPVAVHRLDTDTSGCLLLARNPKALVRFTRAFEERVVAKRYLGISPGEVQGDARDDRTLRWRKSALPKRAGA